MQFVDNVEDPHSRSLVRHLVTLDDGTVIDVPDSFIRKTVPLRMPMVAWILAILFRLRKKAWAAISIKYRPGGPGYYTALDSFERQRALR